MLANSFYNLVASATFLVYDITLTFDQEVHSSLDTNTGPTDHIHVLNIYTFIKVQSVWHAEKTYGTTLFFLVRVFSAFIDASYIFSQNLYIPPCLLAFDLYCMSIGS